jgi:hypothetical protein
MGAPGGAFLNRLSFFLLFPEEAVIETTAGKVHDSFWLKSAGGMEPIGAVEEVLQRYLQGSVAA